jgi:serine protease Do
MSIKRSTSMTLSICLGVIIGVVVSKALDRWPSPVMADTQDGKKVANDQAMMFRAASKKIAPSVVNVFTMQKTRQQVGGGLAFDNDGVPFFRKPKIKEGTALAGVGSGFVFDEKNGYILTNNHVVTAGEFWKVRLADKREFDAKLVGTDPQTDVAVLKIEAPDLVAAQLGDSDDLEVGDWVLAVGNPFGMLEQSVTAGIISAKGRRGFGLSNYENFLQTDAAINPGNSGGPLVNLNGDVVGINAAIISKSAGYQGIGFSIPINQAKRIAVKLIKGGTVVRGWMGVQVKKLAVAEAKQMEVTDGDGVSVEAVVLRGPAHRAGLLPGDVLLEVNGKPVRNPDDIHDAVADMEPGSKVQLTVKRKDERKGVVETLKETMTVGTQPKDWNTNVSEEQE